MYNDTCYHDTTILDGGSVLNTYIVVGVGSIDAETLDLKSRSKCIWMLKIIRTLKKLYEKNTILSNDPKIVTLREKLRELKVPQNYVNRTIYQMQKWLFSCLHTATVTDKKVLGN